MKDMIIINCNFQNPVFSLFANVLGAVVERLIEIYLRRNITKEIIWYTDKVVKNENV